MAEAACPFCRRDVDPLAIVCQDCGRDIGVPATLLAEEAELLRKRETLLAALEDARARLARRRRLGRDGDAAAR
jgi:hypothetical protein